MSSCPDTVLLYDARDAINNVKSFVSAPNNGQFDCGGFGSCDQLYTNLANGSETDMGLTMKINQASPTDINNQIKYNLAQLADGRIREMARLEISQFGTLEWFQNNILNYDNPVQLMVYIMSLIIVFGIVIYGLIKTFAALRSSLDTKSLILMVILFVIGVSLILSFIYYFTFNTGATVMIPHKLPADTSDYINFYKQQGLNVEDPSHFSRQTHFVFVYTGLFAIMLAIVGILFLKSRIAGSNVVLDFVGGLLAIGILAYVVATNLYYMIFIPQLVLMFIILQTFVGHTGIYKKPIALVIAAIIFIYAFVQAGTNMIGYTTEKCYSVADCEKVKNKNQINSVYFIFFFLIAVSFAVLAFLPDYDGWNLLLTPLFVAAYI